jgi:hypothetical protein
MPKVGWGAVIRGEPMDLAAWAHVLKEPFDPWVETHNGETVLRSTAFDELESANEVRDRAIGNIDRLNGAMAVSQHSRPVRFEGIIRFEPDGSLHRTAFLEPVMFEARGFMIPPPVTVIGPDGQPVPAPPMPSDVQNWFKLADGDDRLADALIYFGRATERFDIYTDWFDIYKALECLIFKFGGERDEHVPSQIDDREKRLSGRVLRFLKLGWAPCAEVKRLRWTANSARHARGKYDPPEKRMPAREARELMERLLRRALEEAAK